MTKHRPIKNPEVARVFDAYPKHVRKKLEDLRNMIFEVAAETKGVGELEEALRWGQPSFITSKPKSGSLIRIDRLKSDDSKYAVFFHCQTGLVETFRSIYPDGFCFDGKRALVFSVDEEIPEERLRHCISIALTQKLKNRNRDE